MLRERIDCENAAWLTHEQLQELGVEKMGDRSKILKRAQTHQEEQQKRTSKEEEEEALLKSIILQRAHIYQEELQQKHNTRKGEEEEEEAPLGLYRPFSRYLTRERTIETEEIAPGLTAEPAEEVVYAGVANVSVAAPEMCPVETLPMAQTATEIATGHSAYEQQAARAEASGSQREKLAAAARAKLRQKLLVERDLHHSHVVGELISAQRLRPAAPMSTVTPVNSLEGVASTPPALQHAAAHCNSGVSTPERNPLAAWVSSNVQALNKDKEVRLEMRLDMDFSQTVGNEDTLKRGIARDTALALGGALKKIKVVSLRAGSVIAHLILLPGVVSDGRSAEDAARELEQQGNDPSSLLMAGEYTSKVIRLRVLSCTTSAAAQVGQQITAQQGVYSQGDKTAELAACVAAPAPEHSFAAPSPAQRKSIQNSGAGIHEIPASWPGQPKLEELRPPSALELPTAQGVGFLKLDMPIFEVLDKGVQETCIPENLPFTLAPILCFDNGEAQEDRRAPKTSSKCSADAPPADKAHTAEVQMNLPQSVCTKHGCGVQGEVVVVADGGSTLDIGDAQRCEGGDESVCDTAHTLGCIRDLAAPPLADTQSTQIQAQATAATTHKINSEVTLVATSVLEENGAVNACTSAPVVVLASVAIPMLNQSVAFPTPYTGVSAPEAQFAVNMSTHNLRSDGQEENRTRDSRWNDHDDVGEDSNTQEQGSAAGTDREREREKERHQGTEFRRSSPPFRKSNALQLLSPHLTLPAPKPATANTHSPTAMINDDCNPRTSLVSMSAREAEQKLSERASKLIEDKIAERANVVPPQTKSIGNDPQLTPAIADFSTSIAATNAKRDANHVIPYMCSLDAVMSPADRAHKLVEENFADIARSGKEESNTANRKQRAVVTKETAFSFAFSAVDMPKFHLPGAFEMPRIGTPGLFLFGWGDDGAKDDPQKSRKLRISHTSATAGNCRVSDKEMSPADKADIFSRNNDIQRQREERASELVNVSSKDNSRSGHDATRVPVVLGAQVGADSPWRPSVVLPSLTSKGNMAPQLSYNLDEMEGTWQRALQLPSPPVMATKAFQGFQMPLADIGFLGNVFGVVSPIKSKPSELQVPPATDPNIATPSSGVKTLPQLEPFLVGRDVEERIGSRITGETMYLHQISSPTCAALQEQSLNPDDTSSFFQMFGASCIESDARFVQERRRQIKVERLQNEQIEMEKVVRLQHQEIGRQIQAAKQRDEQGLEIKLQSYDLIMTSRNDPQRHVNKGALSVISRADTVKDANKAVEAIATAASDAVSQSRKEPQLSLAGSVASAADPAKAAGTAVKIAQDAQSRLTQSTGNLLDMLYHATNTLFVEHHMLPTTNTISANDKEKASLKHKPVDNSLKSHGGTNLPAALFDVKSIGPNSTTWSGRPIPDKYRGRQQPEQEDKLGGKYSQSGSQSSTSSHSGAKSRKSSKNSEPRWDVSASDMVSNRLSSIPKPKSQSSADSKECMRHPKDVMRMCKTAQSQGRMARTTLGESADAAAAGAAANDTARTGNRGAHMDTLDITLTLSIDFCASGPEESLQRYDFERNVCQDLVHVSSLPISCFRIKTICAGSIIIDFEVSQPSTGAVDLAALADVFKDQAADSSSPLYDGVFTQFTHSIQVKTAQYHTALTFDNHDKCTHSINAALAQIWDSKGSRGGGEGVEGRGGGPALHQSSPPPRAASDHQQSDKVASDPSTNSSQLSARNSELQQSATPLSIQELHHLEQVWSAALGQVSVEDNLQDCQVLGPFTRDTPRL